MQGQMAESVEKPAKSRSEHKHRSIQQAGTDIFLQRGYGAAPMDMIAAEAGVSKQTVYNHFQSKEGLFKAAIGELPSALMAPLRSEEHTSELQSLMRISYAVFCLTQITLTLRPLHIL